MTDYVLKAEISRKPNETFNKARLIFMIAVIVSLVLGPIVYEIFFSSYNFWALGWMMFGLEFEFFVLVIVLHLLLLIVPLALEKISEKICKNTSLFVSEDEICGSYSSFIFKKTLQMPIEKIDNLTVTTSFFDKLFSGKTLEIFSNSGMIKFHFVQNADEFVKNTMDYIKTIKQIKKENNVKVVDNSASKKSVTERINELNELKKEGFITEEEYLNKKKDLISDL